MYEECNHLYHKNCIQSWIGIEKTYEGLDFQDEYGNEYKGETQKIGKATNCIICKKNALHQNL